MHLKGLEGVSIVGSSEDDTWKVSGVGPNEGRDDVEAIHAWHVYIEEEHIGLSELNQINCFLGVRSFERRAWPILALGRLAHRETGFEKAL